LPAGADWTAQVVPPAVAVTVSVGGTLVFVRVDVGPAGVFVRVPVGEALGPAGVFVRVAVRVAVRTAVAVRVEDADGAGVLVDVPPPQLTSENSAGTKGGSQPVREVWAWMTL
jgi:hypothetical protein